MLLVMLVSLYTVRIVLNALGVVDYGIYNVVGGVVTMFAFLSNSMASASQRFFAFEIGRKNQVQLQKNFSATLIIYVFISIIIFILAETIGLWFVKNKMNIPIERLNAAYWVYQFSVFSFVVTVLTIPYNAVIIARENMRVYAYVSIVEVILKLVIAYSLILYSADKLKLYAVFMLVVTVINSSIYRIVCKKKYTETEFLFFWDKKLLKTLLSYSGWNLFGSIAGVFGNQGVNILLNIFFGPSVNAARAIAYQVNGAANQFVMSFMTASRPQIIKYYALKDMENMYNLVFRSAKFSFFLLLLLSMPILLETNFILKLWLKTTPEYVVLFTRLIILTALVDSLSYPLMTSAQATGKIRQYQTLVGGILLLNLPVSYLFLKLGYPPQITMVIALNISIISLIARLFMLKGMIELSIKSFIRNVLVKIIIVAAMAYIIPIIIHIQFIESFSKLIIISITGGLTCLGSIYLFGLSGNEKNRIGQVVRKYISTYTR
jgi:O-antigen/teichoic acid export membrane protein